MRQFVFRVVIREHPHIARITARSQRAAEWIYAQMSQYRATCMCVEISEEVAACAALAVKFTGHLDEKTFNAHYNALSARDAAQNLLVQALAASHIRIGHQPYVPIRGRRGLRFSREHDKNVARIEPKRRVERERLHVESILKEADAPRSARSFQNRFHQLTPDSARLYRRIDDNRADRADRVSLAEKIETYDPGVAFGHHSEHRRVSYETGHALRCYFHRGKTKRIAVALINGAKSLEADATACISVHVGCTADGDVHGGASFECAQSGRSATVTMLWTDKFRSSQLLA
jgi:hypothetical protein